MPNNLTDTEENRLLDLSLIDGDLVALMTVAGTESSAGVEVVGGAYARQPADWAPAAAGSKATVSSLEFPSMPDVDVQGWEVYDATGTDRKWYGLFGRVTATAQAGADTITLNGHGLPDGTKVVIQAGYAPAGLAQNTTYYVRDATANTFRVSATLGGVALDITTDSSQVVLGKVLEAVAGAAVAVSAGNFTCALA